LGEEIAEEGSKQVVEEQAEVRNKGEIGGSGSETVVREIEFRYPPGGWYPILHTVDGSLTSSGRKWSPVVLLTLKDGKMRIGVHFQGFDRGE